MGDLVFPYAVLAGVTMQGLIYKELDSNTILTAYWCW